jgi:hypothetical protein
MILFAAVVLSFVTFIFALVFISRAVPKGKERSSACGGYC